MNKFVKMFLFFVVFIVVLWVIGRVTNTLQFYSIPSSSNEPTIRKGDRIFVSNLKKPKRFDFICFYTVPQYFDNEQHEPGKEIWVFRVCGIGSDIVEIRQGNLFINNEPVDRKISPKNEYHLPLEEYRKIKDSITVDEENIFEFSQDSVMLFLEDNYVKRQQLKATRIVHSATYKDEYIAKEFSKNWNADNFGPIKVPANKYFVLGDNRHNAQDSRYIGFIDKKDYLATVLWK